MPNVTQRWANKNLKQMLFFFLLRAMDKSHYENTPIQIY